jgi:hypothetical protein
MARGGATHFKHERITNQVGGDQTPVIVLVVCGLRAVAIRGPRSSHRSEADSHLLSLSLLIFSRSLFMAD